jgi:AcrR family transcriptional regulator
MAAADRKRQIVEVTMGLVATHGVQATSTSRIAAAAGVSEATLYRHFGSRQEMLLAAMDLVYERVFEVIRAGEGKDPLDRLRAIGRRHSGILTSEVEGFVYPLFEFVAAPPSCGLREALAEHQRAAMKAISQIIEQGIEQKVIRPDTDAAQIAWELVGVYWTQDISYLMGLTEYVDARRGRQMMERILASIAVDQTLEATEPA